MTTKVEGRPRLTLLSRSWCHLCDDMLSALAPFQAEFGLDIVDVDTHAELEQRYGEDVPVLLAGEREICRHRLDTAALTAYLKQQDSSHGFAAPQGQIG